MAKTTKSTSILPKSINQHYKKKTLPKSSKIPMPESTNTSRIFKNKSWESQLHNKFTTLLRAILCMKKTIFQHSTTKATSWWLRPLDSERKAQNYCPTTTKTTNWCTMWSAWSQTGTYKKWSFSQRGNFRTERSFRKQFTIFLLIVLIIYLFDWIYQLKILNDSGSQINAV